MARQATMNRSVTVGALSTNDNVLVNTDEAYRRAPFNATGRLYAVASAADLSCELTVDGRKVVDQSSLRISASPIIANPDDMILGQFWCRKGALIALKGINTNAASRDLTYRIVLEEDDEPQPAELVTQAGMTSIANGARVNVFSGRAFERARIDSMLAVYMAASATGLLAEIYVEQQRVSPSLNVSPANRVPINPYDLLVDGIECPADQLISIIVSNNSGGAVSFAWRAVVQELGLHPDMVAALQGA